MGIAFIMSMSLHLLNNLNMLITQIHRCEHVPLGDVLWVYRGILLEKNVSVCCSE